MASVAAHACGNAGVTIAFITFVLNRRNDQYYLIDLPQRDPQTEVIQKRQKYLQGLFRRHFAMSSSPGSKPSAAADNLHDRAASQRMRAKALP
jgi:hypothetical protein